MLQNVSYCGEMLSSAPVKSDTQNSLAGGADRFTHTCSHSFFVSEAMLTSDISVYRLARLLAPMGKIILSLTHLQWPS